VIPIYAFTDIRGRFSCQLSTAKDFHNLVSRTKNVAFDFADKIVGVDRKQIDKFTRFWCRTKTNVISCLCCVRLQGNYILMG
jgi:hypothetical protein